MESGDKLNKVERLAIESDTIEALKRIYDPEIPVNIYDLGLIYSVDVREDAIVHVEMTLTAPGCPVAVSMPIEVEESIKQVRGVFDAIVDVVWDPPWTPDRMSEAAKLELGWL
ncbi:MAG: SUF system Fe-S cluster assembly protein [Chthonomonadales bacterium]|nr:SUF system Fe-S cluster assembly protein [Chthonomonadales bacterium]